MAFRPQQRQPSTLSNNTYHTGRSNTGSHHNSPSHTSTSSSLLRRQESKHQIENLLQRTNSLSISSPYPTTFDQLIPLSGNKPKQSLTSTPKPLARQTKSNTYLCTGVPDEEPLPHYVLIPIGKTGDGKSSLLNSLFGYQEFKAAAAAKSVTDTVVERTGVWTVDKMNHVVTVADTPGFADSAGRDFTMAIQDYIMDVSDRVGIDAFLLVFQLKSQQVMSILKAFAELMKDMEPNNWWDHVILVFTRVDYTTEPQKLIQTKRYITQTLREEIKTTFGLETPPPAVFVSSKVHQCPLLFGKGCDCVEVKFYQNERMRILKETIAKCGEGGRWRATNKKKPEPTEPAEDEQREQQPPVPVHSYPYSSPPPPQPPAHYNNQY
ncbi:unnamed protein product [Absidia cylindrospora]